VPFVIDASAALAWFLAGEATPDTTRLLKSLDNDQAFAPALWPTEVANGLLIAARRGRSTVHEATAHLFDLMTLPVRVEPAPDAIVLGIIIDLAHSHRLTTYDSSYLELALRHRLPLASLDEELRAASRREGIDLLL